MTDTPTPEEVEALTRIMRYAARPGFKYQTGEGTNTPTFIFADADYEIGDGSCGLHECVKRTNEPGIVYVRADSYLALSARVAELEAQQSPAQGVRVKVEPEKDRNRRINALSMALWDIVQNDDPERLNDNCAVWDVLLKFYNETISALEPAPNNRSCIGRDTWRGRHT